MHKKKLQIKNCEIMQNEERLMKMNIIDKLVYLKFDTKSNEMKRGEQTNSTTIQRKNGITIF